MFKRLQLSTNERIFLFFAACILIISIIPRFITISNFLPFYSVDENEIVEYALGFFGEDKDPHWYKYGPFFWYILKFVYKIQSIFAEGDIHQFVQNYFFNKTAYFYTARIVSSFFHISIAVITFFIGRKHLSKGIGFLALCIAIFPFTDILTNFRPRVDTLLALNLTLTLFFGLFLLKKSNFYYYILCGVFLGFSLASKPIPVVLILPALGLILYLKHLPDNFTLGKILNPIGKILTDKYFYLFLFAAFIAFYIASPYAFKSFDLFWQEQIAAIKSEGSRNFESGANIFRFKDSLGFVFIFLSVIASLYGLFDGFKNKRWTIAVLAVYILTYWGVFALGAARNYFYVPIVPPLVILIAFYINALVNALSKKFPKIQNYSTYVSLLIVAVILIQPIYIQINEQMLLLSSPDKKHTVTDATTWTTENVPAKSKILYYGYYTSLPDLVDMDINEHARYGDFFMYNRGKNKYWVEQFSKAYGAYFKDKSNLTYDIVYNLSFKDQSGNNQNFYTRYRKEELEPYIFQLAAANKIQYIYSVYDLDNVLNDSYVLLKSFSKDEYEFGKDIKIYSLKNL